MMQIFLIEDDIDDVELFQMALSRLNKPAKLTRACNGQHALEMAQDSSFPKPDMVFLDLNMPVLTGVEFLAQLRQQNLLADVPVFIYSTSSGGRDVEECLRLGAQLFTKHSSFGELLEGLKTLLG